MSRYTKQQEKFIFDNYKTLSNKELTKRFNKKFGTNKSVNSISLIKSSRGWLSGEKGNFAKGRTPYNKADIGAIEVVNGYELIKVDKPERWIPRSQYVWEQQQTGEKLKKGEIVTFLDGNNRNYVIENLMVTTKSEIVQTCKRQLRSSDYNLTKVGIGIVRLGNTIRKKNG